MRDGHPATESVTGCLLWRFSKPRGRDIPTAQTDSQICQGRSIRAIFSRGEASRSESVSGWTDRFKASVAVPSLRPPPSNWNTGGGAVRSLSCS